jgi:hypothetical protein
VSLTALFFLASPIKQKILEVRNQTGQTAKSFLSDEMRGKLQGTLHGAHQRLEEL